MWHCIYVISSNPKINKKMKNQLEKENQSLMEKCIKVLLVLTLMGFNIHMVFCSVTVFTVVMIVLGGYLMGKMVFTKKEESGVFVGRQECYSVLYIVASIICLGFFLSVWCGIVFFLLVGCIFQGWPTL